MDEIPDCVVSDVAAVWLALEAIAGEANRSWLTAPMRVDGWTAATDGRVLAAVRGELPAASPPARPDTAKAMADALAAPVAPRLVASLADLGLWAGRPSAGRERCPKCRGRSRKQPLYVSCTFCDGEGEVGVPDQDRTGLIAGLYVNRRLLARGLWVACAADPLCGEVNVGADDLMKDGQQALVVWPAGGGWRVVLMSLKTFGPVVDAAVFSPEGGAR